MRVTAIDLVAGIIEQLEREPAERGRPRLPAAEVVGTLQFFLREGIQWRELFAGTGRASGSTLRRRLREWRAVAVLPRVHAVLLRMTRSSPETAARALDIVVDSCSVRAKHGGELTGPNPTDRGKRGTKYHIVVSTEGLPLGAVASAANNLSPRRRYGMHTLLRSRGKRRIASGGAKRWISRTGKDAEAVWRTGKRGEQR